MRTLLAATLLAASGLACAAGLTIESPWIREAPLNARAVGGFMVIQNDGDAPQALIGAKSAAFGEIQLHQSIMEGGMAKMVRQEAIEIPAKGKRILEPGSYHLMLMAPKQPLKAGEEVEVTLEFKGGESRAVRMPVRAGGEAAMQHDHGAMHHGH